MEENKRSQRYRCTNFSSQERNILIHVVEKHQEVLASSKSDPRSVAERHLDWEFIAQEYNEMPLTGPVRTPRQLKNCFENVKRKIRKENLLLTDSKSPKSMTNPAAAFRSCSPEVNDDSYIMLHDLDDSEETNDDPEIIYTTHSMTGSPQSLHGNATQRDDSIEILQRSLLKKQIQSANLDITMKTKKYALELKVEEAKLDYYKKKCQLLFPSASK